MIFWILIKADHLPGPFKYVCTINSEWILLRGARFTVLSQWGEPLLFSSFICLWQIFLLYICHLLLRHPPFPVPLCCFCPPAESKVKITQKKGVASAAIDNFSPWCSVIIHASLSDYLLSLWISVWKSMRKVEAYVALINFSGKTILGVFKKLSSKTFNEANFWPSKQVRGSPVRADSGNGDASCRDSFMKL